MPDSLPQKVVQKIKNHPSYKNINRVQAEACLNAEGDFLLRPSRLGASLFELFVFSYRFGNENKHCVYGISMISGQCFQFEETSEGQVKPVKAVNEIDFDDIYGFFIQQLAHRANKPQKGIIISTQTPDLSSTRFPCRGGTAIAIHHVTGLPLIPMHRNGLPLPDEKRALKRVKHGGIVFITGHGFEESNQITGEYSINQSNQTVQHEFPLASYRDLIVNHSSLQQGDTVRIVLFACQAGLGGEISMASQLGELLLESGINSKILCSVGEIVRFNGQLTAVEQEHHAMRFPSMSPQEIRFIEFTPKKVITNILQSEVYFSSTCITNNLSAFLKSRRSFFKENNKQESISKGSDKINPDLPGL